MRASPGPSIRAEAKAKTGIYLGLVTLVFCAGVPFASTAEVIWKRDSWALLAGALALSLAAVYTLAHLAGRRAALRFMASTLVLSWLAEGIGLQGGWLFASAYRYHPDLHVVLPGGVPAFIPLAWFTLACFPVMVLSGMSSARPDGSRDLRRLLYQSGLAAVGMVGCDLTLDPVAVSLGLWTWDRPGPYFGIPWLNFAGWWVVAFVIFGVGYAWAGLNEGDERRLPLRYDLAWGLAQVALLVLLGLGAFHRLGSAWPLLLTLAALVPVSMGWFNDLYWRVTTIRPLPTRHGES